MKEVLWGQHVFLEGNWWRRFSEKRYSKFCSEFILPRKNIILICIRSTNSFLIKHIYCLCGSVENEWKYKHALIFALYFYSNLFKNRFWTNILFDNIIFLLDIRPRFQFDWIWSVRLCNWRGPKIFISIIHLRLGYMYVNIIRKN